jgi:outer membrane protein assembly factor BamD
MFKYVKIFLLFFAATVLLAGCSDYQKLLKTTDLDKKYEGAIKYYNEKDYVRALPLLEELVTAYRATKKAEKVSYYFAYTNYGLEDYAMASYNFDNFTKNYPNSEYTEECYFMSAYCNYLDSPGPSLDQTNTYKAISEMQLFIDKYPTSTRVAKCNEIIDILRGKLEDKTYATAKLYFNMEYYKAAVTCFKIVIKDFPDTKYMEDCLFLTIKAHYFYAKNSIEIKKTERYKAAMEAYHPFLEKFPKSKYLKEATAMYEEAGKQIEKLKLQNS